MKSIILLFILFVFSIGLKGQYCHAIAGGGSCCVKGASAAMAAARDADIEVRKDVATGDISFYKKTSCAYSERISYTEVKYDAASNRFVDTNPGFSSEAGAVPVSLYTPALNKVDCSTLSKSECAERMARSECSGHNRTARSSGQKTALAKN